MCGWRVETRDVEMGQNELPLHLGVAGRVEQGDLQQIVAVQHLARHADLLRHQADGRDAAALAVAAVLHLNGRLVDELARRRARCRRIR